MAEQSSELKNTTYEVFMAALSVLSIFNIALMYLIRDPVLDGVVGIMNGFFTVLFLFDFGYRILTAESRVRYFVRGFGWADLLACVPLPQFKVLRLFRLVRVVRLLRRVGPGNLESEFTRNPATSALLSVLLLLFLLLEFGGLAMVAAERRAPNANITSASDSIWYTYVTMTTVGYGDKFPVTNEGRVIGMIIMAAGVGLFGTLTGFLANAFLSPKRRRKRRAGRDEAAVTAAGPETTLAELRRLVGASRAAQDELETKLSDLERQLGERASSGGPSGGGAAGGATPATVG
jgi:voltage-gated potassium channel Kch